MGIFSRRARVPPPVYVQPPMPVQVKHPILYERPYNIPVAVSLFTVIVWNSGMLTLAIIAAATFINNRDENQGYVSSGFEAGTLFFWCTVPFVIWVYSLVDLYKRWKRTMSPLYMLVSSSFGLTAWMITLGVWFPCTVSPSTGYVGSYGITGYCPAHHTYLIITDTEYYATPFVGIGSVVLYAVYLLLAIMIYRPRRHARQTAWDAGQVENGRRSGYKVTSSVYTHPDSIPDSLPSTFHMDYVPPPPPPLYGNKDYNVPKSNASSHCSRHSSARSDRKGGQRNSACTCQCHH